VSFFSFDQPNGQVFLSCQHTKIESKRKRRRKKVLTAVWKFEESIVELSNLKVEEVTGWVLERKI